MNDTSYVSPGQGVPRYVGESEGEIGVLAAALGPDAPPEPAPEPYINEANSEEWCNTPTYADQWWRFPEQCRPGPIVTAVFRLNKQEDVDKLNALMSRAEPPSAPDIVVCPGGQTHWSETECTYVELVKYRKLLYKKLIKPV